MLSLEQFVAPCMQGKYGQLYKNMQLELWQMYFLITHLGEVSQSPRLTEPIGDVIGALAYALMIFDPGVIESILVKLLKPRDTKLIQERILEAMASLYGNSSLSCYLDDAEANYGFQ